MYEPCARRSLLYCRPRLTTLRGPSGGRYCLCGRASGHDGDHTCGRCGDKYEETQHADGGDGRRGETSYV